MVTIDDKRGLSIVLGRSFSAPISFIRRCGAGPETGAPGHWSGPVRPRAFFQDFTLDFYFRQFWTDPRLAFNRKPGVETLSVGSEFIKNIWVPDTFFVNEKQSYFHIATTSNEFIRIHHSGSITRSIRWASDGNFLQREGWSVKNDKYWFCQHVNPVEIENNTNKMIIIKNFKYLQSSNHKKYICKAAKPCLKTMLSSLAINTPSVMVTLLPKYTFAAL